MFNWSSPDEWTRRMHVRNFRRLLEIANDLEVPMIATELSGDPNRPTECEWAFYASIEELAPDFEKYGISCTVEAHPYDFIETNARCVDIVRGVDKDWFNYEFCCAHAFHLGQGSTDLRSMMAYAGEKLAHVHVADVFNHIANVGNRYIVNPPGVDARIHQHNEIGNGEVPWDQVFGYLRDTNYDGQLSVCVFGWEEKADEIHVRMRERIEKELSA